MKTVIERDGVQTVVALEDGALVTGTVQDCTPIAEHTKALHNEGVHGSADLRHAASLPFVLVERYCNDHGISFEDFMRGKEHIKAMLNDPALKHFRIWPGKL